VQLFVIGSFPQIKSVIALLAMPGKISLAIGGTNHCGLAARTDGSALKNMPGNAPPACMYLSTSWEPGRFLHIRFLR
jgi:hypothetical protein